MGKRLLAVALFAGVLLFSATSCSLLRLLPVFLPGGSAEQPDKTGSYGQINQQLYKPENWKQIVKNSRFHIDGEDSGLSYGAAWRYGTYPCIDGSTVTVPMSVEFARQHLGLDDDRILNFVWHNTTPDAYENLIYKRNIGGYNRTEFEIYQEGEEFHAVDLILVTEPSEEEKALAQKQKVELTVKPVCYDAFVFITHKDNPVDSLTVEQVQKIYSGEIKNWKELGGKDEKIKAFQREKNSGSQTTMEQRVMQGKNMQEAPQAEVAEGMGELVKEVAEYHNQTYSIGYTFQYYIETLYKNDEIKTIKINGIKPEPDSIKKESYPFTTKYYGVIRTEEREKTGGIFLDWILSGEGQDCIEQAGYCALK